MRRNETLLEREKEEKGRGQKVNSRDRWRTDTVG